MRVTEATTTQPGLRTQLFRFVLTGGLSAIVDHGLLVLLMALGLDPHPGQGAVVHRGHHDRLPDQPLPTFNSIGSRRKFAAVMALYALTFVLQVGIFTPLYPWLVSLGLGAEFARR